MRQLFKNISDTAKGYIIMAAGLILLLHTWGVLEKWLGYILVLGAFFMIVYGFMESGLYDKCLKMLKK